MNRKLKSAILVAALGLGGIGGISPAFAGSAALVWNPSVTTGFTLYYGTVSGTYSSSKVISGGTTSTADLTGLVAGTKYYFALASLNGSLESGKGGEGSGTADATGKLTVSWTQAPLTSYNVYEGAVSGTLPNKFPGTSAPNLTITTLAPGNHCFVVKAVNATGESGPSNEVCAVIPVPSVGTVPCPPGSPVIVTSP